MGILQFKLNPLIPIILLVFTPYTYGGGTCNAKTSSINLPNERKMDDSELPLSFTSSSFEEAHYALDPRKTKQLANLELHLINYFTNILKTFTPSRSDDTCFLNIKKYLKEYETDSSAINQTTGDIRSLKISENPLLTFRLIRRIVTYLLTDTVQSCKSKFKIMEPTREIFSKEKLPLPVAQDLNDTLDGILRIQYIYGLDANDLRLGILKGVETGVKLNYQDCLALANAAISIYQADIFAYQWLVAANNGRNEDPDKSKDRFARIELEAGWKQLQRFTKLGTKNALERVFKEKKQKKLEGFDDYKYHSTCRGEIMLPLKYRKMTYCYFERSWDRYFYINPAKIEVYSLDPVIAQVYDFVGDEAIDFMKGEAEKDLSRSQVMKEGGLEVMGFRTSMSSWIREEMKNCVMRRMNRRIEKMTGLKTVKQGASELQVVFYGAMGHYTFHYDSLQQGGSSMLDERGDRAATFLIYLSDVELGGYTAFPEVGIYAKPVKGSALFWYPSLLNGMPDKRTVHGGCPVLLGSKIVANKWIFQNENMFRQPCSLDPQR